MPNKNDVIEILFGVKGGGSISGESGQNIKADLDKIANQISLKVKVNRTFFTNQLKQLKAELEKTLGNLNITINRNVKGNTTSSNGSASGLGDGGATKLDVDSQIAEYERLYKELVKYRTKYSKIQPLATIDNKEFDSTNLARAYTDTIDEIGNNLRTLRKNVENALEIPEGTSDQLNEIQAKYEAILKSTANIEGAKTQDRYSSSIVSSFNKIISKGNQLHSTYSDLINSNETAAAAYGKLQDLMNMPLDKNPEKAAAQVNNLKNRVNETSATLARLQTETDTIGNKIRKAFDTAVIQKISYAFLALAGNAIRKVYQNVVELDAAITDLQIATGYSREQTAELVKTYGQLASQLGATVTEVTSAADTWLRQGYSVAETNELITATMMLSKLGQIESTEASKALTSALKGYKLEAQEVISVVDKLTAVDMEAATSAGDIATAMAETAASAEIAGVSMDRLIGYISTVAEVTQDGAESVGTFYRTLFARMGNIKVGNFTSDDGEDLNDVEKVVNSLGISLRGTDGLFRDFGEVLDEVGNKWENFNNVQQHAIATAFAGTRQQEKFIVLMENYATALEYANTAAESGGTAEEKFRSAYLDGIQAGLNSLTASWQTFSQNVLDSDLVKIGIDFLRVIVDILNEVSDVGVWTAFSAAAIAAFKKIGSVATNYLGKKGLNVYNELFAADGKGAFTTVSEFSAYFKDLKENAEAFKKLSKLNATPGISDATKIEEYNKIFGKDKIKNIEEYNAQIVTLEKDYTQYSQVVKVRTKEIGKSFATLAASFVVFAAISAGLNAINNNLDDQAKLWANLVVAVGAIVVAVVLGIKAMNKAMNSNPILLAISLALTAIMGLIDAINGIANSSTKAKEDAIEAADASKQSYEDAKSELEDLESELETTKDRIAELQEAADKGTITFVEQEELEKLERAQKLLETQIATQQAVVEAEQEQATKDAVAAIEAIREEASARENGWNKFWFGLVGADMKTSDEYAQTILNSWDRATDDQKKDILAYYNELKEQVDTLSYYNEDNLEDWQVASNEAYDYATKMMHQIAIAQGDTATVLDNVFAMDKYEYAVDRLKELADAGIVTVDNLKDLAESNSDVQGILSYLEELGIFAWDDTEALEALIEQIQNLADGLKVVSKVSYADYLEEYGDLYSGLASAIEEINESGSISSDTIQDLLENYADDVGDYFEFDPNRGGYVLKPGVELDNILVLQAEKELQKAYDEWVKAQEEFAKYEGTTFESIAHDNLVNAEENFNNLLGALGTLIKDPYIEQQTELLESQQDEYENQLDQYNELIELRKKLLETYQEEVDYRRELNKKQANVSDLQAQLALARLDTSAAGQARARELQSELEDAQNELNDYTLENAIEKLESYLDADSKEYEAFINKKVEEIQESIEKLGENFRINVSYPDDVVDVDISMDEDTASASKEQSSNVTRKRAVGAAELNILSNRLTYHSGGFVGGLESNEEFAKLLKGEFVSTPEQMDRFMSKTVPAIASGGTSGAVINNNSPLVTINCGNVSNESLPALKDIVSQAVSQIEKNMESALTRSGYKKKTK